MEEMTRVYICMVNGKNYDLNLTKKEMHELYTATNSTNRRFVKLDGKNINLNNINYWMED